MKSAREVTPEKLRGGYYTPPVLARFCLSRLAALAPSKDELRLLEPSIGDGAFVRALGSCPLNSQVDEVVGFEVLEIEAEKARQAMRAARVAGRVESRSVIDWAATEEDRFDLAVGNPPFVRFQFVSPSDRAAAEVLAQELGVTLRGVSNLWIPVLLGALSKLHPGGAFAFVVPTECFTGCSAQIARDWLLANVEDIHFDLFPPGSFPGVLQEVTVLSGRRAGPTVVATGRSITISEHDRSNQSRTWTHSTGGSESWTRYLLEPRHLAAVAEASSLPSVRRLGEVVAFEVSIVTGANDFFSVDRETIDRFALADWARPLLPRIKHAPGLRYTPADQSQTERDARGWILDFSAERADPADCEPAAAYIDLGESRDLHTRFKCRIREPWYRVPNFRQGALLLSKRSHEFPRVIVNDAAVFTTDTIYRGRLLSDETSPAAFAAGFHNSLTALTAEIEGRSFGGGVLEMVPSEVARLRVPILAVASSWLGDLDHGLRSAPDFDLIAATDSRLVKASILSRGLIDTLSDARLVMQRRRLERNAAPPTEQLAAAA